MLRFMKIKVIIIDNMLYKLLNINHIINLYFYVS